MTIWRDPDIRKARDLHRAAADIRRLALQAEQRGDPLSAALCRDFAREEYGKAVERYLRRYRRRRLLMSYGIFIFMPVVIIVILALFMWRSLDGQ